ncbi:RHS repeat domain-containing protein [Chryseobacterium sediminis]|uniref:RHS repeat-associated core domain-containing protein n=1 Tax=Chryseobacterium sediminis TaxID=1679494 RepID=A0A5B2U2J5_9FLAO|nr:RHS repeat-associated core domain-containing protein [Chryseobacterium sediminis]KAA2220657.1 RHS repeat-associated core domain-containing protein [Chryseobacterium sediminis]
MLGLATMFSDAFSKIESAISGLIRITNDTFYRFSENRYIYQYKDHLGNVRIAFAKDNAGVVQSMDTNNYYPFGLNHIGGSNYSNFGNYYNYKYNGKELQETGMYDYGARMYMSDLGRWGIVDPLAEKTRRFNPYNYALGNPICFIDPDGRSESDWFKNSLGQMEFRDDVKSQQDLENKRKLCRRNSKRRKSDLCSRRMDL